MLIKKCAGNAPYNVAIWEEFSELQQHQSTIFNTKFTLFGANTMKV